MTEQADKKQLLLVSGLSGAGKSTALKTLEDIGWEVVDNLPISLVGDLLATPPSSTPAGGGSPLAICFDSRTRGFDPDGAIDVIKQLHGQEDVLLSTLFLDCAGGELGRRYSETRRRHPLALDRPARDGIALERTQLSALRRWADHVIDTTDLSAAELQQQIRQQYARASAPQMTVTVTSFGFSRGVPNNVDLLLDVRFLSNPFWVEELKLQTGLDQAVADYIRSDAHYDEALDKFRSLLLFTLPRYRDAGKAYVNIGIGCTGGRHRSVHVAETIAGDLRDAGFSPTVQHRNLASRPMEALEVMQKIPTDNTN